MAKSFLRKLGDHLKELGWDGRSESKLRQMLGELTRCESGIDPGSERQFENVARAVHRDLTGRTGISLPSFVHLCRYLRAGVDEMRTIVSEDEPELAASCDVDRAFRDAALNAVREALNCDLTSFERIKPALAARRIPDSKADAVAHVIQRWERLPFRSMRMNDIVDVCQILNLPIEQLIAKELPRAQPPRSPDLRAGVRLFVVNCKRVSCYVVFVPKERFMEWRASVQCRDSEGEITEDEQVRVAREWTASVNVFAASDRLCDEHQVQQQEVAEWNMGALIDQRLQWIREADNEFGDELAGHASREIHRGVFDAVARGRVLTYERYPSLQKSNREGPRLKSLQVCYEGLAAYEGYVGWIIYYEWHPPLTPEEIASLLERRRRV